MLNLRTSLSSLAMMAVATCGFTTAASATEGYAANGFGARSKALAGAGAADSRDATAASLNPAGLTHVGNEIDFSVSVFSPRRGFDTEGGGSFLPANASINSDRDFFFIPNMAVSTRAFANPLFDVAAFTLVGNGGMNTSYAGLPRAGCPAGSLGTGIFCMGPAGVNLLQMIMSVAVAKQVAPGISIGVAPMMALQTFESRGLEGFGFPIGGPGGPVPSNDPSRLTGGVNDWSYGFGVRGGIEVSPMRNVRLGVTANTPIWMEDFNHYTGLFANRGEFDIPASVQAGIAVDLSPQLTVMFDWRHIWFSSIDSVGNPSTNLLSCVGGGGAPSPFCLGGSSGPGFGWKDVDAFKFGVEYRANQKLTLRAGYAYNTQPVQSRDVLLNVLAPAVSQHHITGGLEYDLGSGYHLELSGMYSPESSVTGTDLFSSQVITDRMWQFEGTVGIKYKFGEAAAPLK